MTRTSTWEYFAFDGPLHPGLIAILAIALAALVMWSLRRESEVIGTRKAILFGVLRLAALGITAWMLLSPASIRSEKSETRKAVAFVVDVSPSMHTLDPPAKEEDVRWILAVNGAETSLLAHLDQARAAVVLAEQRLIKATAAIRSQQPESVALELAATANEAISQVRSHVEVLRSGTANPPASRRPEAPVDAGLRVAQILDGPDLRLLAQLAGDVRRGRDSFRAGWRESLLDIQYQVTELKRRLNEWSRHIGAGFEMALDSAAPPPQQASRLERVAEFVQAMDRSLLASLRSKADVRQAEFDSGLRLLAEGEMPGSGQAAETPGEDTGVSEFPVTDLAATLEQLRRLTQEQPVAAVFLFTDAAHNRSDGRDPQQAAAEIAGTPVYVVPVGNTNHVRDVVLKAISAPGVVMKDDDVVVEATVQAWDCQGDMVRVELLRDGEVVQEREVQIDSATALTRLRFNTHLQEVGVQRFQMRIAPLPGELSEENNLGHFEVNVTRDRISVLLADQMPRWEFRYLAQLFRRDPKIECDELLFQPRVLATGKRAESKRLPESVDEWDQYDVALLGDIDTEQLAVPTQQALASFVRDRGGTLVVIAGNESMPHSYRQQPLEELLPVTRRTTADDPPTPEGYAFHLTDAGWQHDALMIADTQDSTRLAWEFINRNSPLYSLSEYRQARPTARTLIAALPRSSTETVSAEDSALLSWQPVGRGRVVYLASPETYRLRFLRGDRLHYRFWGQLLRWAVASDLAAGTQLVSIRTDRPDYRQGDRVDLVVRLRNEAGEAVVGAKINALAEGEGEQRFEIPLEMDPAEPGRYIGHLDRLPTGIYRVQPAGEEVERLLAEGTTPTGGRTLAAASFTVRAPLNRETLETRSDRALAQQIAEATGGQVLPPTAIAEVLNLTNFEPIVSDKTDVRPLWVQWKYLWIVFGCLLTEWAIRKQMGLS